MITREQIEKALESFQDPYLNTNYLAAKVLKEIHIEGQQVTLSFQFGYPVQKVWPALSAQIMTHLQSSFPQTQFTCQRSEKIKAHATQPNVAALPSVKNVIAIASGKGGVGKSTTAVNVAIALAAQGARVGLLDADIYGPNQPHMLKAMQKPELMDQKFLKPVEAYGLQTMSMGYLVNEKTPAIWRGPMVSSALQQLVMQTAWDDLDYLLIDMPPGTGDIQLTLAKKVPVSAAVMVTTPQDVALIDVRKGLTMFRKVDVTVLGVVENMSMHTCSKCGHEEAIFGENGAKALAQDCDVPLLGQLPLDRHIREHADRGEPIATQEDSALAIKYRDIALKIAALLSIRPRNYAQHFGNIAVE